MSRARDRGAIGRVRLGCTSIILRLAVLGSKSPASPKAERQSPAWTCPSLGNVFLRRSGRDLLDRILYCRLHHDTTIIHSTERPCWLSTTKQVHIGGLWRALLRSAATSSSRDLELRPSVGGFGVGQGTPPHCLSHMENSEVEFAGKRLGAWSTSRLECSSGGPFLAACTPQRRLEVTTSLFCSSHDAVRGLQLAAVSQSPLVARRLQPLRVALPNSNRKDADCPPANHTAPSRHAWGSPPPRWRRWTLPKNPDACLVCNRRCPSAAWTCQVRSRRLSGFCALTRAPSRLHLVQFCRCLLRRPSPPPAV